MVWSQDEEERYLKGEMTTPVVIDDDKNDPTVLPVEKCKVLIEYDLDADNNFSNIKKEVPLKKMVDLWVRLEGLLDD